MKIRGGGAIAYAEELECQNCGKKIPRKSAEQRYCSRACWKTRYVASLTPQERTYHKFQHKQGTVAPALKQACEALEAQLTPENRREWPAIIERFGWPRTPGYRDLANLTRDCVRAKLHLMQ